VTIVCYAGQNWIIEQHKASSRRPQAQPK